MRYSWTIELQDLRLGYGDTVILENITATLPAGCISVILGASGGGKSTLLRHIIGLARPFSGKILLGGKDLFSLPGKEFRLLRRRMGVLFQDGALLGALTVGENVGLPLTEHTDLPPSLVREVVLHKLALVGLADFADHYPSELSGGMRKRAGLARALVTDPPILLCDEPTSGLDPVSAAQMDDLLLDMKCRFPGMTIVSVSHDMASVRNIADHVLVLHKKNIVYAGGLSGLEESADPYLRRFLDRKAPRYSFGDDPRLTLSEETQKIMHQALDSRLERG
ncbi:MAG: ATP-binding cassette domain-containing protein [Desulfovibrio sp.]|jgi:phospholipid/cholesterol/gamma-HCH transport system ATP-binding protein|nr:ATP-binding cassette domain-containing protein [Desulfovibrio sp.]